MKKIITVKSTEMVEASSGNQYMRVHGSDDKTYSIFQEGLWNLFNEGLAVELTLDKNQKGYWNVTDAKSVAQELAEKQAAAPAPQELGMWWKELGECLRSGEIDKTTPHGKLLRAAYYAQMFQVLNLKVLKKEES